MPPNNPLPNANAPHAALEKYQEQARLADATVEALETSVASIRQQLEYAIKALEKNKAEAEKAHKAVARQETIVAKLTAIQPQVSII